MTTPRSIITIKDTAQLPNIFTACEEVEISDHRIAQRTIAELKATLRIKLPKVGTTPATHNKPAYLAANQLTNNLFGTNKRIVLFYLPPTQPQAASEFVMLNPTYTCLSKVDTNSRENFRISTFLADQLRFADSCYAAKIRIDYLDEFYNRKSIELDGLAAIAAQMGINYVYGITPLDHGIQREELLALAEGSQADTHKKVMITRDAYVYHGREKEIVETNDEFSANPDQLQHIKGYLEARSRHPILFDPTSGERLAEKAEKSIDLSQRHSRVA